MYAHEHPDVPIVNLDAMYYCAAESNVDENVQKSGKYTLIRGNICDAEIVAATLQQHQITHVIHFAAQSHVQRSFTDAIQYTKDNILGTHTLLEECRKWGKLERFIHVSTDEVYGESALDGDELKKTESSVLCPTNPYAATKAGAELIARSYQISFGMPIIITRGNNVYGPNQYPEKLIPCFITQLLRGERVTIQGDGSNIRGFLYVADVCRAFSKILENGKVGEIYNIGCDGDHQEYTVMQVAKMLIERIKGVPSGSEMSAYEPYITYIPDRPFNDKRYFICNEKMLTLGWQVSVPFEEGLERTIEWYAAQQ
jgi:UDP-glucose 4,6-dehydratase